VIAGFHSVYLGANPFNDPCALVPQYARQREGQVAIPGRKISMTDCASDNSDQYFLFTQTVIQI
jgi:hypothetical protein